MPTTWPAWFMFCFFAIGALGGWLRLFDFIETVAVFVHGKVQERRILKLLEKRDV